MDQQELSEPEVEVVKPNSVGRNLENIFKQEVPVQQSFDQRLASAQPELQVSSITKSAKEPASKSSVVPPPALSEIASPGKLIDLKLTHFRIGFRFRQRANHQQHFLKCAGENERTRNPNLYASWRRSVWQHFEPRNADEHATRNGDEFRCFQHRHVRRHG